MIEIISRLPSNYQEVEYIKSNGSQYIDTGYIVNASDTISWEFTARILAQTTAYMGANGYLQFCVNTTGVGISTSNSTGLGLKKTTFRIDFNNSVSKLYIDNVLVETKDWSGSYNGTNVKLGIFKLGEAGNVWHTTTSPVSCTLYEYAINIGGNEVSRCVPCYRKSDGTAGMYDLVNSVFYTNAGSGAFTVGTDVKQIVVTEGGVIPQKYALRRMRIIQKNKREIWYFNDAALDAANRPSDSLISFIIGFESNGERYERIDVSFYQHPRYPDQYIFEGITYLVDATDFTVGLTSVADVYGWNDNENYRTFILDEPATGELLEWLSKVATKLN